MGWGYRDGGSTLVPTGPPDLRHTSPITLNLSSSHKPQLGVLAEVLAEVRLEVVLSTNLLTASRAHMH
jgi:hypothetical protein